MSEHFLRLRAACTALMLAFPCAAVAADEPRLPLVPLPASIVPGTGTIAIADGALLSVPAGDAGAATAARLLAAQVKATRGLTLAISGDEGVVRFVRDPAIAEPEGYVLTVAPGTIRIAARDDAGLVYGAMTLAQLLSPDARFGQPVRLAATTIRDAPRFAWRGFMLDVTRHFQPIESIRAIVDAMAAIKLNTLHLHLSDDQGWRVEIKRYPELTRIGAWRDQPSAGGAPGPRHGGFYTQDELRELVAYASDRAITIVPEIDLPGHAQAIVAAYPQYGVLGDRPQVSGDWGVNPYLVNVDAPSLKFVEDVLDELMTIFPSKFIHVGGDEAIKDQWKISPAIQAKMAALGIETENGLQSWFINRLGEYLAKHDRRLIGWDEILEGGLPPSASVMSWRGVAGAVEAANAGHDVVLSPAPTLYLDSLQTRRADEPAGRRSFVSLADLYGYDPMPPGIAADKARHILGLQANAWAEYMVTPRQVQHMAFPKLAAVAEIGWSPAATHDWAGFLARLDPQRLRFARTGIAAADTAFAVDYTLPGTRGQALRDGTASVALATQTGYGTIRYRIDGKAPTARDRAYAAPVAVRLGTTIRAAAFTADGRPTAAPRAFDTGRAALLTRTGSDLAGCGKGTQGLRVPVTPDATDWAPVFNVNLFDTCSTYPAAPLDIATGFVLDAIRLPRHYGLAHDATKVTQHFNLTRFGELVVRVGSCEGPVAASFPLPDPATASNRMTFRGDLPAGKGDADLCLLFTAPVAGPYYAVEKMVLTEGRRR